MLFFFYNFASLHKVDPILLIVYIINKYAANLNTLDVIEQYEVYEGIEADIDSDANDKDDTRMWERDGNNKKSFLIKGPSKRVHIETENDGSPCKKNSRKKWSQRD